MCTYIAPCIDTTTQLKWRIPEVYVREMCRVIRDRVYMMTFSTAVEAVGNTRNFISSSIARIHIVGQKKKRPRVTHRKDNNIIYHARVR